MSSLARLRSGEGGSSTQLFRWPRRLPVAWLTFSTDEKFPIVLLDDFHFISQWSCFRLRPACLSDLALLEGMEPNALRRDRHGSFRGNVALILLILAGGTCEIVYGTRDRYAAMEMLAVMRKCR